MEKWAIDRVVDLILNEVMEMDKQAKDEYNNYLKTGKVSRRLNALGIANGAAQLCEVASRLYQDQADDFEEGK